MCSGFYLHLLLTSYLPCGTTLRGIIADVKFPESVDVLHLKSTIPSMNSCISIVKSTFRSYEHVTLLNLVSSEVGGTCPKSSVLKGPAFIRVSTNNSVDSLGFPILPLHVTVAC